MPDYTAEITQSDDVTGNYSYKAGKTSVQGFYDSQHMQSSVKIRSPSRLSDLDLINLIRRTNLDYVGVIRLIDEITEITHITGIDTLGTLNLINTINTITNIANIERIGNIPSFTSTPNIIKNSSFTSNNFSGFDYIYGATLESVTITGVVTNVAKLVSGGLFQYLPAFMGSKFKFSIYAKSVGALANNCSAIFTFIDGTSETIIHTIGNVNYDRYFFEPTSAKRLQSISVGWNGVNDTLRVTSLLGIIVDDDLQGNIEVLPKAKGHVPIRRNALSNGAAAAIYTVTAAKTFYLVEAVLTASVRASGVDDDAYLEADTGGDAVFLPFTCQHISTSALIDRAQVTVPLSFSVPMPFPAATQFRARTANANTFCNGSIVGWEE